MFQLRRAPLQEARQIFRVRARDLRLRAVRVNLRNVRCIHKDFFTVKAGRAAAYFGHNPRFYLFAAHVCGCFQVFNAVCVFLLCDVVEFLRKDTRRVFRLIRGQVAASVDAEIVLARAHIRTGTEAQLCRFRRRFHGQKRIYEGFGRVVDPAASCVHVQRVKKNIRNAAGCNPRGNDIFTDDPV